MHRYLHHHHFAAALIGASLLLLVLFTAPVRAAGPTCREVSIAQIQGAGQASPLAKGEEALCTTACVTGVGAEGFFVQSLTPDTDPSTSEGVYVFRYSSWKNPRRLKAGDRIHITGFRVQEYYGQTEIVKLADDKARSYQLIGSCPVPEPVAIQAPGDAQTDLQELYERTEGMRVAMTLDASVTGPTQRFPSRFPQGEPEITVVDRGSPFFGRRIFAGDAPAGRLTLTLSGGLGVDLPDVAMLDRIASDRLTGILAFQFGRYTLLVDDAASLRVEHMPRARITAPLTGPDEFTICTYNAENLFDAIDDGDGDVGDWSPRDQADYGQRLVRQAEVMREGLGGCTVIGLQEVEGKDAVWEALAYAVGPSYRYDYWESQDVRDITVGILFDAMRVEVWGSKSVQACSHVDYGVNYRSALGARAVANPCAATQFPLYDRPPYLADLAVRSASGDRTLDVRVIVTHLKSKRGEETENEPRRMRQAQHVASLMDFPRTIVLGDLNDSLGSRVLKQFRKGVNLYVRHVAPQERYSYVYQGRAEAIDHFIMTAELDQFFVQGGPVHLNADWPETRDPQPYGRVSDHDPLRVRFAFRTTGVSAAFGGALSGAAFVTQSHLLRRK